MIPGSPRFDERAAQATTFLQRLRPRRHWTLVTEGLALPKVGSFNPTVMSEVAAARGFVIAAQSRGYGMTVCLADLAAPLQRPFTEKEFAASSAIAVSVRRLKPDEAISVWGEGGEPSAIIDTGFAMVLVYCLEAAAPMATIQNISAALVAKFERFEAAPAWLLPLPGTYRHKGPAVQVIRHNPQRFFPIEKLIARPAAGVAMRSAKASTFEAKEIPWLWRHRIPAGEFVNLAGRGAAAKTTMLLGLAATLSRGGQWPDGSPAPKGSALVVEAEDPVNEVTIPRLLAAGADLDRVGIVDRVGAVGVITPEMLEAAEKDAALRDLRMVILSPIRNLIGDNNQPNNVIRDRLMPLLDWARRRQLVIFNIMHPVKGNDKEDAAAIAGSAAYVELARMNWLATSDAGDVRKVINLKTNIAPQGIGSRYRVRQAFVQGGIETTRVEWLDEIGQQPADVGAQRPEAPALAGAVVLPFPWQDSNDSAAIGWLREQLAGGPRAASDILAAAGAANVPERSVYWAAKKLNVKRTGSSRTGGKVWEL